MIVKSEIISKKCTYWYKHPIKPLNIPFGSLWLGLPQANVFEERALLVQNYEEITFYYFRGKNKFWT